MIYDPVEGDTIRYHAHIAKEERLWEQFMEWRNDLHPDDLRAYLDAYASCGGLDVDTVSKDELDEYLFELWKSELSD